MTDNLVLLLINMLNDAGGKIIGRTKLQKMAYILSQCGLGDDLEFDYHHYGPYSENLSDTTALLKLKGLISEEKARTSWGGVYSTFSLPKKFAAEVFEPANPDRKKIIESIVNADSVELELAATALFLKREDFNDPWLETKRRKPEKANEARLSGAKLLYSKIQASCETANILPALN